VRPVSGAVTASVPQLTGYEPGQVVVCYPSGQNLWVHRTLPCSATPEAVREAVRKADEKKGPPPPGSGRILDWS
jgi:hypothetical protein